MRLAAGGFQDSRVAANASGTRKTETSKGGQSMVLSVQSLVRCAVERNPGSKERRESPSPVDFESVVTGGDDAG